MPLRPSFLCSLRPAPIPFTSVSSAKLLRCRTPAIAGHGLQAQQRRGRHEEVARKNHYERLNVRHDATPAEIKKSFYSLSKTHHPDANRSDPNASSTFSLISESYTVLSNQSRREAYDRDVLRLHHHPPQTHAHRGSYHSHQPGGRAPSGLSRRRGTFRGPPPSFYRSGGWGDQADKRRQAHEESTGGGGASHAHGASHQHQHQHQSPWGNPFSHESSAGGMGPGDDPFGHQNDVPHFDRAGHTRTHRREDQRRKDRRERRAVGDDDIEFEPQTSIAGHFVIISGILVATILAPLVYLQFMRFGRQKKDTT
ncbi:hypothetical protein NW762_004828 [Fusarium torreyae]|uniref:J domain-containing protein n=1 Tax=Fusarium torreyae TaxID=1237075 RepID=A0A9W8S4Z0_9HYPO|nr:hypothetical protein NW762_004828 [Fusarium torreyae]